MSSTSIPKRSLRQQPKNPSRRSKEEREALEKAANEQRQARLEAIAADEAAEAARRRESQRGHYGIREGGRGRGTSSFRPSRGRGGFMGPRPDRPYQPQVLGPSAPKVIENEVKEPPEPPKLRSTAGHAKTSKVKREPVVKVDPDGDMPMQDLPYGKKAHIDGGYISSDPDEGAEGPRQDVNTMFFTNSRKLPAQQTASEEDDVEDEDPVSGGIASTNRRNDRNISLIPPTSKLPNLPIRIPRRPHEDRRVMINRDVKGATYSENRRSGDEITLDLTGSEGALSNDTRRKGKRRSKDVQFVSETKIFHGVYQDEDSEMQGIDVKDELDRGDSENDDFTNTVAASSSQTLKQLADTQNETPAAATDVKLEGKHRRRSDAKLNSPKFATIEEQLESQIRQNELRELRQELGSFASPETHGAMSGKTLKSNSNISVDIDNRANNVYLFQLPPIIPELRAVETVKTDPDSPEKTKPPPWSTKNTSINNTVEEAVKIEDDEVTEPMHNSRARRLSLASGKVGKLRIHESGRATLSWGGTCLELSMGMSASFLQTAVLATIPPTEPGLVSKDYGGEVMSFGQVRGKFVVTPDWKDIFG